MRTKAMEKAIVIIVVCLFLTSLSIFSGCKCFPEDSERIVSENSVVSDYRPEERFTVVSASKQIDGLQMGKVVVKRKSDGICFSALVVPNREITKGTTVELLRVSYKQSSSWAPDSFVVVK